MNTFDAVTHTYTINGRRVPSVTQVLGDLIPGWMADPWYLERGTQVHAAAAFIAKGIEFDADPQIAGQVAALRRFFAEVKPGVLGVEGRVYSDELQYAGTFDLLADIGNKTVLVDFKASATTAVPYQLAAYGLIEEVDYGYGVEIHEDGNYRMTERYDLRRYKQGWMALLTAYGIRRKCGIQEGEQ